MSVTKDVIETNRLHVGTGGTMNGLYVGAASAESKYAVITDENSIKTVIYDKVHYEFGVSDISGIIPAYGGTYSVPVTVSTRTHGDGTVDNDIAISPASITIPANTGGSYSSSVTITQVGSNLTQSCSFTVEADYVTSLQLTLGTPSVIPASGGSVNSTTYNLKAVYKSGRIVDNLVIESIE